MSDTVLIALITFLSGAVGAIAGVVGSHIASKNAARAQLEQVVLNDYFEARLKAFTEVHEAMTQWSIAYKNTENIARMYQAVNAATMVASEETALEMHKITDMVRVIEMGGEAPDSFPKANARMLLAMQHDMKSFEVPSISR